MIPSVVRFREYPHATVLRLCTLLVTLHRSPGCLVLPACVELGRRTPRLLRPLVRRLAPAPQHCMAPSTTLLRLAARRAASPAFAALRAAPSAHASAQPRRAFHSGSSSENRLKLDEVDEQNAAEHDTLHENKEYLQHEKNLVRLRRLCQARDERNETRSGEDKFGQPAELSIGERMAVLRTTALSTADVTVVRGAKAAVEMATSSGATT